MSSGQWSAVSGQHSVGMHLSVENNPPIKNLHPVGMQPSATERRIPTECGGMI